MLLLAQIRFHEIAAPHHIEELVGPAKLCVHLHRHGVVPLQDGVDHLVEVQGLLLLYALLKHAAFEKLLDGELVHDLDELREGDFVEPP